MPLLDDIASYLLANGLADYEVEPGDSLSPRDGWGLCRAFLPPAPDHVVVVGEYAGNPPTVRTDRDEPGVQIRVRGAAWEYDAAKAQIDVVRAALHGLGGDVGAGYYVEIDAQHSAFPLGNDTSNRPEFACNFIARRSR